MNPETVLIEFVCGLAPGDVPEGATGVVQNMILTVLGTAAAGADEDGCRQLREVLIRRGGAPEATSLVHGDRLPAPSAAQLNGTMARALDFCDAMAPGLHLGSALIPAALAAAELRGRCAGEEFLTAVTVGAEVGSRLNLSEAAYDGFDPTGVAGVLGATATVCRILELTPAQTLHALALAFNRCGGSFQSNVDGSLAVRLIQGWAAEAAVGCALLAQAGLTGPRQFLSGLYGYAHLFGRDMIAPDAFVRHLGDTYALTETVFKKYPSCGLTQGATELALQAFAEGATPGRLEKITVRLPPYAYRLVGHPFVPADNPRVDAQFSVRYCVANALLHGSSELRHFDRGAVTAAGVVALAKRIDVVPDTAVEERGHTAVDLLLTTTTGVTDVHTLDIAPGFPGNPLSARHHLQRLTDCLEAAPREFDDDRRDEVVRTVAELRTAQDVAPRLLGLFAPRPSGRRAGVRTAPVS